MTKVYVKNASYDYPTLKPRIFDMMDRLGGASIQAGARVTVKPNLLAPATPESAMLTHPLVVRAVVEYAIEKGARVQVSDSPAMGSFDRIMRESGIKEALEGLDVECREFRDSTPIEIGLPFNRLELAEDALNCDFLINLPKLKTHSQMLLTLGVKNLFGCVVGLRKPQWHLRTGVDREMFAALLARIYQTVKPSMTILDGILAMEGEGPGKGGIPRPLGALMGSRDATAIDVTVCRMLGVDPDGLLTNAAAGKLGILAQDIEIEGQLPSVNDFALPDITPLIFGPKISHRLMRKHLIQRPIADASKCKGCGDCLRYCPAKAISLDGKKPGFDYEKCIRCYCCLEVCPHGALSAKEPYLGRLFTKVIRWKSR